MKKTTVKCAKSKASLPVAHFNSLGLDVVKTELKEAFQQSTSFRSGDGSVELDNEPFPCCRMSNFVVGTETEFLQSLKDELLSLDFIEKSNDLYKFHQSNDLRKVKAPYIASLRSMLYGEFREWVQDVVGLKLNDKVDMSCARYDYTDVLLCHDDQLEGRRIAYIYYLLPPWETKNGGALQLFNCDESGEPLTVTKSINPEWNSFVFFLVSPKSFHQVSEVLTEDKTRLSISGWFYGEPIEYPSRDLTDDLAPTPASRVMLDEEIVGDFLNPAYIDYGFMTDIRRQKFEKDSEVLLLDFLKEDKFRSISDAIKDLHWTSRGPPNKRKFDTADLTRLPEVVHTCLDIMRSDVMLYMLSTVTGLKLHELASDQEDSSSSSSDGEPECKTSRPDGKTQKNGAVFEPKFDIEIRRFGHGSYTLLHDADNAKPTLDVVLFFNCEEWQSEHGGYICYVAKDEDEELLTINPNANALALVYRDTKTMHFVKHVNHRSTAASGSHNSGAQFHTVWCQFYA